MDKRLFVFVILCWITASTVPPAYAQPLASIKCGDIVEGEVVAGQSQMVQVGRNEITVDDYLLEVRAGTRVNLTVEPLGGTFNPAVVLRDSGGNDVIQLNETVEGQAEKFVDYPIGSSNQIVRILGVQPGILGVGRYFYSYPGSISGSGGAGHYFGGYQIRLGCTLRDGTVIEPGDAMSSDSGGSNSQVSAPAPASTFSGTGFPGLAPVDFSTASPLPLSVGVGTITPGNSEITAFNFEANAGDVMALDFARLAGNLNLGLVVLSSSNEVVFQASLVTSESLSTRLTLPSAGQYTIGVFRIDLLPPANPEATAFQIIGTLNP